MRLAITRVLEFAAIVSCALLAVVKFAKGENVAAVIAAALGVLFLASCLQRIRKAHFDWLSSMLAIFGLPLFAILLLNSDISHRRGLIRWKGRCYGNVAEHDRPQQPAMGDAIAPESRAISRHKL